MTAKVAAFVGSPRKGGNTDLLVQAVLKGAKVTGADASIFYLYDYEIHSCRACYNCKKPDAAGCVIQDDMQQLYDPIREADAIVFGPPIYMGYMTGQAKTFLDRWYAFVRSPHPLSSGKWFVPLLPHGRPDTTLFALTARWMASVFEYLWHGNVETLLARGFGKVLK
jgi:multimeric flavodoxin WrbA